MKKREIITTLDECITLCEGMRYVTATDRFLTGWGCADGKIAKRIIICDNYRQAQRIADAFVNEGKQFGYVNITDKAPNYNESKYVSSWSTYEDFNNPCWMRHTHIGE